MSWNVNGIGRAAAVAKNVAAHLDSITHLQGPEVQVKEAAGQLIAAALAGFGPKMAVLVQASGHQTTSNEATMGQVVQIKIEPIHELAE